MAQQDHKGCTECGVEGVDLSKDDKKCIYCFTGQSRPADSPFQPQT